MKIDGMNFVRASGYRWIPGRVHPQAGRELDMIVSKKSNRVVATGDDGNGIFRSARGAIYAVRDGRVYRGVKR